MHFEELFACASPILLRFGTMPRILQRALPSNDEEGTNASIIVFCGEKGGVVRKADHITAVEIAKKGAKDSLIFV
jgi:hypothetical protein